MQRYRTEILKLVLILKCGAKYCGYPHLAKTGECQGYTEEHLGFTGREEGLSAKQSACCQRFMKTVWLWVTVKVDARAVRDVIEGDKFDLYIV